MTISRSDLMQQIIFIQQNYENCFYRKTAAALCLKTAMKVIKKPSKSRILSWNCHFSFVYVRGYPYQMIELLPLTEPRCDYDNPSPDILVAEGARQYLAVNTSWQSRLFLIWPRLILKPRLAITGARREFWNGTILQIIKGSQRSEKLLATVNWLTMYHMKL